MNGSMRRLLVVVCSGVLLFALTWAVLASPAAQSLHWWTVDGGGATSTGGGYTLSGTVGQPDAGLLAGGDYTLGGGFWGGGALNAGANHTYLPLVLMNGP